MLKKYIQGRKKNSWDLMIIDLQADLNRYPASSSYNWLLIFLGTRGMWVMTQYRFSRWIHLYCHFPLVRHILKLICFLWQKVIECIAGAEIPNRAKIGKGLLMPHTNGIVIHVNAVIGENCNISQQVTIGVGGRGKNRGTPKIGDRVFIGPGAKIFGYISIGNDVAIGANAVVTKDLPDKAVAVGVPARVINYEGSKDYINPE